MKGQFLFASQLDGKSSILAYSPTKDRLFEFASIPGNVYSVAWREGEICAYVKHLDTYAEDWLAVFDDKAMQSSRPLPSAGRRLRFVNSTAWGLAYDGDGLLALSRSSSGAEVYSVVVRESERTILARPVERSVTARIPITNENANPYRIDMYLACPSDQAYQQVSNLVMNPPATAMYEDGYGNRWAHFALRGSAEPLEVTQTFNVFSVNAAQTFEPDYVFRPATLMRSFVGGSLPKRNALIFRTQR